MIFVKSINLSRNVSGRSLKLRPLPGQYTTNTGEPIIDSYNVAANMASTDKTTVFCSDAKIPLEWKKYPDGTIFVCDDVVENPNFSNSYSAVSDLHFIASPDERLVNPLVPEHAATEPERNAWMSFVNSNPSIGLKNMKTASDVQRPKLFDVIRKDRKYACPTISQHGFSVAQTTWELLMRNIIRHQNTLMTGPTGTGKTALVELACSLLHLPLAIYDMGEIGKDTISGLCGVHRIGPDGSTYFDKSKFVEDVQKPGVILLDELSRAQDLNVLLPCLDHRRTLPLYMAGSDQTREIKIHPECVFFATANIGESYTGTYELDPAVLSRFMQVEVDYLNEKDEREVLINKTGIDEGEAASIVRVCSSIRAAYGRDELERPVSTRESLACAALVADGLTPREAMTMTILPLFKGTLATGERNAVAMMFANC